MEGSGLGTRLAARLPGLLRVTHSAMTNATRRTFHRATTIGATRDHRLADLATGLLDLTAGLADFLSRCALGLHGICFRCARLVGGGFLCCMRNRHKRQNECDGCDDLLHELFHGC